MKDLIRPRWWSQDNCLCITDVLHEQYGLLKCPVLNTIIDIVLRFERIFEDVLYIHFHVDLYPLWHENKRKHSFSWNGYTNHNWCQFLGSEAFSWSGRNWLETCWKNTIILMIKRPFNSEQLKMMFQWRWCFSVCAITNPFQQILTSLKPLSHCGCSKNLFPVGQHP